MKSDVAFRLSVFGCGKVVGHVGRDAAYVTPAASLSSLREQRDLGSAAARRLIAALTLLLPLNALADQAPPHAPTPAEFAMQLPLSVSGHNGVVQLLLPIDIYQQSRSPDLADLRVYNNAGQALPYALHRPSYRTRIEFREHPAALFPIYEEMRPDGARKGLELQLRTGADGALVTINAPAAPDTARRLSALIIDLGPSARDEVLESIAFTLPEASGDYRARLAIERSDDLKLWDGIAHDSVDWISAVDASRRLVNERIDVPGGDGRYLKVRWIDGEPVAFASVQARWRGASVQLDPTFEVKLDAVPGYVAGDFMYPASPAIAATAIGLELPEANSVLPVSIGFYRELIQPKRQWLLEPRLESTFYRLSHNGRERSSSRIHVAPLAGSEWVVRPHTGGHAAPKLVLSWQPQTLVFNAQGSGFFISVGAAPEVYRRWLGGPSPMGQVAPGYSQDEIEQLERAKAGTLQATPQIAGPAAPVVETTDSAAEAARMRRFALWSILGFGVLVLGYMTWRLFQQLNAEKPDS